MKRNAQPTDVPPDLVARIQIYASPPNQVKTFGHNPQTSFFIPNPPARYSPQDICADVIFASLSDHPGNRAKPEIESELSQPEAGYF